MDRIVKKSQNDNILKNNINTIAVIGAGKASVVEQFCQQFGEQLGQNNKIAMVTPSDIASLENKTNWELAASDYLSKLETQSDYLIFNCGAENTDKARYLLNHADTLLLVSDAESEVALSPLEEYLNSINESDQTTEKYLVLVHSSDNLSYQKTNLWLENRDPIEICHANLSDGASLRSVARIITGKANTLVLGGGGTGGYAHIGVLQAIEEYGIEIDVIAGVSSGAIIAALSAMGMSSMQITNKIKSLKKYHKIGMLSLQLPISSLFKPKHLDKLVLKLIGHRQIEDLPVKFFALACNLITGEDTIFERGSLADAVVASNSLPGLCSPKLIGNKLFVDGGVGNTLPGDVMKKKYSGMTIVVDVSKKRGVEFELSDNEFPSSLEMLLRLFNPFKPNYKVPRMYDIVNRAITVANKRKIEAVKAIADCVIKPDLTDLQVADHKRMDDIQEMGYQEAIKQLKSLVN